MSLFEKKVSIIYKVLFSLKEELYSRRVASILIGLYPLWLEPIIEGKIRQTLFSRDSKAELLISDFVTEAMLCKVFRPGDGKPQSFSIV